MTDINIEEKIKYIIAQQLNVDKEKVKPEDEFINDLEADSLDLVELVMAFEEGFKIEIPEEDYEKIQTVKNLTEYIKKIQKS